ncbi:MAG: GNAT family N-acetyltransferase, partial [Candidatus Aminicenantes bacterium]|nr:GNAT family N-acetyltransferase [Candidatus Aminicenantes bacterium]
MGVIVRKFHLSDYDRIIELWKEGNLPLKPMGRDSREEIERQIKLPQVIFLVAEFEGQIVGTVMATHDGRKGWINRLAVAKDFRGRGFGQLLVREAEKELEKQGLMIFAALIEEDNEPS